MGKRRFTYRLYKSHDRDILSLPERGLSINKVLYNCLKAFCNKNYFVIALPEVKPEEKGRGRQTQYKLMLDEEKDADIIEMIERVNPGARNNFYKQLIRMYVCYPVDHRFFNSEEDKEWFDERMQIFREGKKCVEAGRKRKKKKSSPKKEKVVRARKRQEEVPDKNVPSEDDLKKQIDAIPIIKEEPARPDPVMARPEPATSSQPVANPGPAVTDEEADEITNMFSSLFE